MTQQTFDPKKLTTADLKQVADDALRQAEGRTAVALLNYEAALAAQHAIEATMNRLLAKQEPAKE